VFEHRPEFGTEDEPAGLLRIVQGFLAHPVPRQEQRLTLLVPQGKGEHPVEMGDAFLPELLVGVDDDLGIRPRLEPVPLLQQ